MSKLKKGIFFLAVIISVTSLTPRVVSADNTKEDLESLVGKHIQEMNSLIPETTWTDSTIISNIIPTHSLDNTLNGYIVELSTNKISTGYIQVGCSNNKLSVISFALSGDHQSSKINSDKLYYLGNLNFAYKTTEKNYRVINDVTMDFSLKDLREISTPISTNQIQSVVPYNAHTLVPNFSSADMVVYTDFPGRTGTCAPTTGTSLIKYWGKSRGMSNLMKANGVSMSDSEIFYELFDLMKTDPWGGGTEPRNFLSGVRNYMYRRSIYPNTINMSTGTLHFEGYLDAIRRGSPVPIDLKKSTSHIYNDHSILGVGFVGTYAIIMDGSSRVPVYINYDNLTMNSFHYIAFN